MRVKPEIMVDAIKSIMAIGCTVLRASGIRETDFQNGRPAESSCQLVLTCRQSIRDGRFSAFRAWIDKMGLEKPLASLAKQLDRVEDPVPRQESGRELSKSLQTELCQLFTILSDETRFRAI